MDCERPDGPGGRHPDRAIMAARCDIEEAMAAPPGSASEKLRGRRDRRATS
jgi:hypothetical protein